MAAAQPKYLAIKKFLQRQITTGAIDHQVPSENQLASRHRVSRMTARKALNEMLREGLVERIPGKGTFVKKPQLTHAFFHIHAFSENARRLGAQTRTQLIRKGVEDRPARLAGKLPGRQVVCIQRVHWLDDRPVSCEFRYLRKDWCAPLLEEDLESGSVHALIETKLGRPITRVWQRLEAMSLENAVAATLAVATNAPAFCLRQLLFSDDEPISSVDYYLRGDVYAFEDSFEPGALSPPASGWAGNGRLALDR